MVEFNKLSAAVALTLVLFVGSVEFKSSNLAYGQFFETNPSDSDSTTNSTQSENAADIVLLSQKLKKASFGYRDLVGQVKNIGSETGTYVKVEITTYDKNGDVLGTDYTYVNSDSLKPNQKSSFDLSSSSDNFKGMDHYDISLQWDNPDGTEGYVENAKIFGAETAFTETLDNTKTNTETNTNTETHSSANLPQTNEYCSTVKTELGKELCDKLLGQ